MIGERTCRIRLTEGTLLIANTGQRFTREGVVAICYSHLSTKTKNAGPRWDPDPCPGESDDRVLKAIRGKKLKVYKGDPYFLHKDSQEEQEVQRDYGGRALWELLQNVDDAMSPPLIDPAQLIGNKGLGFKSVLELTEEPHIYSKPFNFFFSGTETKNLLSQHITSDQELPSLVLSVPHPVEPTPEIKSLLDEGFATVISLPLQAGAGIKTRQWLEDFDERLLLFCQYIVTLELVLPEGQSRTYRVERRGTGLLKDGVTTIRVGESDIGGIRTENVRHYRCWMNTKEAPEQKRHSASICLQVEAGQIQALPDTPPLHVFFPTKENLPFHALVHASFEVEQSRQHIRSSLDPELLSLLEAVLRRIIQDAPPAVVLSALVPVQDPTNGSAKEIWSLFKTRLKESAFVPVIGGELVRPGEAKLWRHGLGRVLNPSASEVQQAALVIPELLQLCENPLKDLGAQPLANDEYPSLLRNCRNETPQDCLESQEVLYRVVTEFPGHSASARDNFLEICSTVPCWWTQRGQARALKGKYPFFRTLPAESLPEWLTFDVLGESFQNEQNMRWNNFTKKQLLAVNDESTLLNKLLVPILEHFSEDAWWDEHGDEVLQLFSQWTKEVEFDSISIWKEPERISLADALKLPTNRGWLPAAQCYAGSEWEGLGSFQDFFRDVADRGILKAPERWPGKVQPLNVEKWKKRLRYAGVSWEPKLLRSTKGIPFSETPPNPWPERKWDCWKDYCLSLQTRFEKSELQKQWAIEFFPECLPQAPRERIELMQPLVQAVQSMAARLQFKKVRNKKSEYGRSLAAYQLQSCSWLSCKPSLLHEGNFIAPSKAYMPKRGLDGLLPEIDLDLSATTKDHALAVFLTQKLKVREDLPSSSDDWIPWLESLPDAVQRAAKTGREVEKAADALYRKFLNLQEKPKKLPKSLKIPCSQWNSQQDVREIRKTLAFLRPEQAYWLDKPYFDHGHVEEKLLKRGLAIFLLRLKSGEKAKEWLGIKPLSEVVKIEPAYEIPDNALTYKISQRYERRSNAIAVLLQHKQAKALPANISFKAVKHLKLHISYQDERIPPTPTSWWDTGGDFLVDAEQSWFGIGSLIDDITGKKQIGSDVETLLTAKDDAEVLNRLRTQGIAESELYKYKLSEEDETQNSRSGSFQETAQASRQADAEAAGQPEPDEESSQANDEGEDKSPDPIGSQGHFNPSSRRSSNAGRGAFSSQEAREEGGEAESWLRGELKKLLPEWTVSDRPVRDNQRRETDILLRRGKESIHIEVKTYQNEPRLFWSEKEVCKAKDYRERYFLALLSQVERPSHHSAWHVYWFWDPLSQLRECWENGRVSGVWDKPKYQILTGIPWQSPASGPVANFKSFHVTLDLESLNYSEEGLRAIIEKLSDNH